MAGNLLRYHSWPTLRQQTIAHHTWNVLRIYRELWGPIPPNVTDLVTYHDVGELNAVDAAHDLKANNPELKRICDDLEEAGLRRLNAPEFDVTPREKMRFKACDLLEMAEFASEEQELGNKLMLPVTYNIEHAVRGLFGRMIEAGLDEDAQVVVDRVCLMNQVAHEKGGFAVAINLHGEDRR